MQNQYYQLLHEFSLGLLNRIDRHDLLQSILKLLARTSDIHHSFLFLYDPAIDRMVRRYGAGIHESLPVDIQSYGRGEAVVGTVWDTGKTLLVEDYRTWEKRDPDAVFSRFTTILAVPVRRGKNDIVGVMGLTFLDEVGHFEPELVDFLERASELAALALDNLMLFETLQESDANARALFDQSVDAMALFDIHDKHLIKANRRFREMTGYSEAELAELTAYDLVVDSRESVDRRFAMEHLSREQGPVLERRRMVCSGGRIIDVERTLSHIVLNDRTLILGSWHDVTAEKRLREQMKSELQRAGSLQRLLLPLDCDRENLKIRTIYQPHHEVSGDFYWYRWSRSGTLLQGFLLDVMGHGIATALQTSAINVLFHQALDEGLSPLETLQRVNRQSQAYFSEGAFAAALCFEIDLSRMTLCYVSGGITCFLASARHMHGVVKTPGSLIGLGFEPDFVECTVPVQAGDAFYFVTDGLMDHLAQDVPKHLHDFDRTVNELQSWAAGDSGRDDASALCFRFSGATVWPACFEISRPDELLYLRQRLREMLGRAAGGQAGFIEVILNEAINNSLRDAGNRAVVRVKLNRIGSRLIIRVKDSGKGFDVSRVLQRLRAGWMGTDEIGDDCAEGGRGLPIMWRLSDRLVYNATGTEVLIAKRIG